LIFLNNDTVVTKNWDKFLLETLEKDPDIWMAGAKLLYPNNTIQHAGVYLPELTGASFGHVYSGFPSCFPPANFEKELQCVTAACMIMRKEDFLALDGFSTEFLNGSEDIDLCLRIIEKGKRIIYQPRCEVFHFESKSEGRFEHSRKNSELLFLKWKNRMRPDMFDMIGRDLQTCTESGMLRETGRLSKHTGWKGLLEQNPGFEVNAEGNLAFTSTEKQFVFPVMMKRDPGDEVMVDIECASDAKLTARLGYSTKSGYTHEKTLNTVSYIYPGKNHLLFILKTDYMSDLASVRFEGPGSSTKITSLAFYTFRNPYPRRPLLSVFYHPATDPGLLRETAEYFTDHLPCADIDWVVTGNDAGPDARNRAIESSRGDYIFFLEKGMSVAAGFLVRAVEVMELQPRIGFVYSDINMKEGTAEKLLKFDFNPLTVLTNNRTDMAGIFRKNCWETARGYDPSLTCFFNTDLFLGILAAGSWKSHRYKIPSFDLQADEVLLPTGYQAERDQIRAKYANYLLKEYEKIIAKERKA
jgi:hypothetical protein